MRAHALDEVGKLLRHLTAVIDTAHHRILKADAAARLLLVAAAGRDQLLQRERIVDRHHAGTGLIVRRMERDRQCQLQMALRQLVDLGHKAAGRQADVAHTDVDASGQEMISRKSITLLKLCSGSPMPIKTMWETRSPVSFCAV